VIRFECVNVSSCDCSKKDKDKDNRANFADLSIYPTSKESPKSLTQHHVEQPRSFSELASGSRQAMNV
jgi:hypothetical protein